jgi:hypothetical protein
LIDSPACLPASRRSLHHLITASKTFLYHPAHLDSSATLLFVRTNSLLSGVD